MIRPLFLFFSLTFYGFQSLAQQIPLINSSEVIQTAKVLSDSGNYAEAIKEFLKVPERDTNYLLMLTEAALTQLAAEQYDEALMLCDKGLAKPSPYTRYFLRYRAVAEDKKGNLEKSVKLFREAIEKYPADFGLLYNLGVTYYNNKQYEKAAETFFQVLSFNPFHAGSHLNLGRIAIGQGRKTHAMLSFGMYLSISNSDNDRLVLLNNFLDNQVTDEGTIPLFGINEAEKMDQIIRAKMAMEKNFKSEIPVTAPVVRQYEMLFQQLNNIGGSSGDPWANVYLPIYRYIKDSGQVEPFIYYLLSSSSIAAVKKWNSKNEKALSAFFVSVNKAIKKGAEVVALPQFGYKDRIQAWYYNDNNLSALGKYTTSETRQGPWKFFHNNHVLSAEGDYNDAGKKSGVWKYYNDDGTLKSTEDYKTGEVTVLYPNGMRREHFYLKDDLINGDVELFYPCGAVREKLAYQNGKRQGKGQTYHENGAVKMTYEYVNDKGNGEFRTYDAAGVLREIENYKDDVLSGEYRGYFANGKLQAVGQYVNGQGVGVWAHYHSNGKLQRKGAYNDAGEPIGEWVYYDQAGVLTGQRHFDEEGRWHGANTRLPDGKLHYVETYKKGVLVQSVFYDRQGKEIGNYGKGDGNFYVKNHYSTGQVQSEGNYRKGKNHGLWKFYNRFGKLVNEYNYVDGQRQGEAFDYYPSGEKKFVHEYKDNELHGYLQEFYRNGQIKQEGWFQDGKREQQWRTYFPDGTLETDSYYLRDSYTGPRYSYAQDGKLYALTTYENGILADIKNYDTKGNLTTVKKTNDHTQHYEEQFPNKKLKAKYEMVCGNYMGQLTKWFPDGSVYYSYNFVNGQKSGAHVYNHLNGKVAIEGSFLDDKQVGYWKSFHINGKISNEGRYVDDERDSVWNYYYASGKISSIITYREGEPEGISRYFSPEGMPLLEKMYLAGDLIAYRVVNVNDENAVWEDFSGTGTITVKSPEGKLLYEETFRDGLRHGHKRLYFANGKLHEEYYYENGDFEGPFVRYYADGKVEERGIFKNDELQGTLETFRPDGSPLRTETYGVGVRHGKAIYYDKGNKKEIIFRDGIIQ